MISWASHRRKVVETSPNLMDEGESLRQRGGKAQVVEENSLFDIEEIRINENQISDVERVGSELFKS